MAESSKRDPGKLLKSGLVEMRRYLLDKPGSGAAMSDTGESWRGTKVGAYVSQVLFANHVAGAGGAAFEPGALSVAAAAVAPSALISNALPALIAQWPGLWQ